VNARILARNAIGARAEIAHFGGRRGVSLVFPRGTRHAPDDDVESGHGGRMEPNQMPTLEERVADLEAKMTPDLRDEMLRGFDRMTDLFGQMDKRFEEVERRFERVEGRFEQMERRFEQVERRFDQVDQRFEQLDKRLDRLENRFERLDDKVDRHFMWIVGIQFTMMIVFIGALAAAYLRSA
jgi:archaellum component FlaC